MLPLLDAVDEAQVEAGAVMMRGSISVDEDMRTTRILQILRDATLLPYLQLRIQESEKLI